MNAKKQAGRPKRLLVFRRRVVPWLGMVLAQYRYNELKTPERSDALPEAVFLVSSLPSLIADYLIDQRDYRLVPLPLADSFRMDSIKDGRHVQDGVLNRRRIAESTIPAFTYRVDPPRPATPIKTLGTRLQLVAHRGLSDRAAETICQAVYESSFAGISEPRLSFELLQTANEFPLHRGALRYYNRKTPVSTEHMIDITDSWGISKAQICCPLF